MGLCAGKSVAEAGCSFTFITYRMKPHTNAKDHIIIRLSFQSPLNKASVRCRDYIYIYIYIYIHTQKKLSTTQKMIQSKESS